MCQTPFQEPDTILFNPHDISQREVMILHIFHQRLRLRFVKVVHGGVQQRGVSCRYPVFHLLHYSENGIPSNFRGP